MTNSRCSIECHSLTSQMEISLFSLAPYTEGEASETVPNYVEERIKVCVDLYRIVTTSKPDRNNTLVLVVADTNTGLTMKKTLVEGGIKEDLILFADSPKTVEQSFDYVLKFIKKRANPHTCKLRWIGVAEGCFMIPLFFQK